MRHNNFFMLVMKAVIVNGFKGIVSNMWVKCFTLLNMELVHHM